MKQELSLFLLEGTAYYFLSINIAYGVLLILSWIKIKRFHQLERRIKNPKPLQSVSFIIPAYNEESLIVETIQTYVSLSNISKEIIIVDDGSSDSTLNLLQTMYQLQLVENEENIYRSITQPELWVIETRHCGKAEALNKGVALAHYDLICTMDADTVPSAKGVEACLFSFSNNPKLIAAGGIIQILGSQFLRNNSPDGKKTTAPFLSSFQRLEYFRTFVCERMGWSLINSTLLISGAFCLVRKEAVKRVGGFRPESITEDFDLIVRLRREYHGEKFDFQTLPLSVCHTQVPRTLKHLGIQRIRWQMGLVQTLSRHPGLFFNPAYGLMGLFAIPYYWMVEVLSPLFEAMAWIIIPYCLYEGWVSFDLVLLYLGVGLLYNLFITLMGVHFDRKYISKAKTSYAFATLDSLLIHLGYKQLCSWWRLVALVKSFRKKSTWGEKPRDEIIHRI